MILSIQSHVAYGYVGNRAAVFPLQRQGYDVITINTVQFSNHTGYGTWTGDVYYPAQIRALLQGLRDRDVMKDIRAVLSGYLGAAETGTIVLETVAELRTLTPDLVYTCDPVIGDVGRGVFVRPDIPDFFRDKAVPQATILTPNQFELSLLAETPVVTLADARRACDSLLARGSQIILVTSLLHDQTPPGTIQMLAVSKNEACLITTPLLDFSVPPNGAGDLTAALFLGHYLKSGALKTALELTATGVFGTFQATHAAGRRELALVSAQDGYVAAEPAFKALSL